MGSLFYWGKANAPGNKNESTSKNKSKNKNESKGDDGWSNPVKSKHELAHERAGRAMGMRGQWYRDPRTGHWRIQHPVGYGKEANRKAAIVVAAGYLADGGAGFADSERDRKEARMFAKEAGVSIEEIEAAAREYA